MVRRRLDVELVRRHLAPSREVARQAIERGEVLVAGLPATKAARLVDEGESVQLLGRVRRFVSRGGEKLEAALDHFAIEVTGAHCFDAGASTGGFTDCLLQRGAASVLAVDVGRGQLAWSLRSDPRVTAHDGVNVRTLDRSFVGDRRISLTVADVSFISLGLLVDALTGVTDPDGVMVLLVKPQFEAGQAEVGRGGVVSSIAARIRAIRGVVDSYHRHGWHLQGVIPSPLLGPAGNAEFLVHLRTVAADARLNVDEAIEQAVHAAPVRAVRSAGTEPLGGASLDGDGAERDVQPGAGLGERRVDAEDE